MITFHRTFDADFVKAACLHHRVWPHLADDLVDRDSWEPPFGNSVFWISPVMDGQRMGAFLFHPHNSICWEVHTVILPEFWGRELHKVGRGAIDYIFATTLCRKIITHVPVYNRLARRLAEKSGLTFEFTNRKSFIKDGEMIDQDVFSIHKEV